MFSEQIPNPNQKTDRQVQSHHALVMAVLDFWQGRIYKQWNIFLMSYITIFLFLIFITFKKNILTLFCVFYVTRGIALYSPRSGATIKMIRL